MRQVQDLKHPDLIEKVTARQRKEFEVFLQLALQGEAQ
jgi:hypothetical protein